ncbi:hypothetical protein D0817_21740 [Flavobacterium cupreum]|uniref:Uncharacterized protein n=1 Tax=Flavobacterium cupreum TaxID=2133766 RepID=A0A434A1T8_9FLAO|nr:hypothetical protein [Flavobacterium cupreum]RUT68350.1 hypothetical protein D0817_21740 [Flavobacterium cupreum]
MKRKINLVKYVTIFLWLFTYGCSEDSDYTNIENQESKVLSGAKKWLTSKQNIRQDDLQWNSAIIYQQSVESSFVAIIPVRTSNEFLLQKIVLEINPYNISGKLWAFNFKEAQSIDELQKLPAHQILENFTGELKIINLESLELKHAKFTQGKTENILFTSKTKVAGICNKCHGDGGAINLDEVVVTGPGGNPWPNPITDPIPSPNLPIVGGGGSSGGLVMPPPPDIPISDILKFLRCFSTSAGANLTVYSESMGGGNGVGHAFIGISQGGNMAVYGYYPKSGGVYVITGQGIMGENGGHHYDMSASMIITGAQLQAIINLSQNYQNANYDISFNNCSDFATEVLNIAGIQTSGWIDTPNTVANILNTLSNHTSGSKNAPKTNRSCP